MFKISHVAPCKTTIPEYLATGYFFYEDCWSIVSVKPDVDCRLIYYSFEND